MFCSPQTFYSLFLLVPHFLIRIYHIIKPLSFLRLLFLRSMLADKLNMTPEEAERWIVNLIRNARLDAKIDSKLVRLGVYRFR